VGVGQSRVHDEFHSGLDNRASLCTVARTRSYSSKAPTSMMTNPSPAGSSEPRERLPPGRRRSNAAHRPATTRFDWSTTVECAYRASGCVCARWTAHCQVLVPHNACCASYLQCCTRGNTLLRGGDAGRRSANSVRIWLGADRLRSVLPARGPRSWWGELCRSGRAAVAATAVRQS
jgi:hypothetical protein